MFINVVQMLYLNWNRFGMISPSAEKLTNLTNLLRNFKLPFLLPDPGNVDFLPQ